MLLEIEREFCHTALKDHPYAHDIEVRSLASGLKELAELLK